MVLSILSINKVMTNEINILLENSIENAILSLNDEIDDLLPPLQKI